MIPRFGVMQTGKKTDARLGSVQKLTKVFSLPGQHPQLFVRLLWTAALPDVCWCQRKLLENRFP